MQRTPQGISNTAPAPAKAPKTVHLRRVKDRDHLEEFYVVSAVNTLEPRVGTYLNARQVDALIVLDSVTVMMESAKTSVGEKRRWWHLW